MKKITLLVVIISLFVIELYDNESSYGNFSSKSFGVSISYADDPEYWGITDCGELNPISMCPTCIGVKLRSNGTHREKCKNNEGLENPGT